MFDDSIHISYCSMRETPPQKFCGQYETAEYTALLWIQTFEYRREQTHDQEHLKMQQKLLRRNAAPYNNNIYQLNRKLRWTDYVH